MDSKHVLYALAAFFFLGLAPVSAEAKGLFVINTGAEIFDVADLPEELKGPEVALWRLGWMCSRFGILWADVWTWDCKLIAYDGDNYSELPAEMQEELEAEYPKSKAERGLWNRFGIFGMLGVVAVLGIVGAGKGEDEGAPLSSENPPGDGSDDPPPMPT